MDTLELSLEVLIEAEWNSNRMDDAAFNRLKESICRFGLVEPLVVRPTVGSKYEVLSGNHRLRVLAESGVEKVPCVIVELGDAEAMLLAGALNGIRGVDDLGLKAGILRKILAELPKDTVISILPETAASLESLSTIDQDDLARHLEAWQTAQAARLKHMQLQFSGEQLKTVEEAIDLVMAKAKNYANGSPNIRGTAAYLLARSYLERRGK